MEVRPIADLNITAEVTRTELGLGNLDLNDDVNFRFGRGVEVGRLTWRKDVVTSPYVHGRFPVREVKDAVESKITVYVIAPDHATLSTNVGVLIGAFTEQYEYNLQIVVEGQTYAWRCERADYEVAFATETFNALFVPVSLAFYRSPIQVAGVI